MRKKYIALILTIVLSLTIVISIGISYALWQSNHKQTDYNTVESGCFNITFSDAGSKITNNNTIPVSDEEGKSYKRYTFTINNTCSTSAIVDVNQELLSDNTLSNTLIKSVLDDNTPVILDNATTKTLSTATAAYKIGTFFLEGNSSQTHSVGLWVDASATVENSSNKVVSTQISVVANATMSKLNDYIISLSGTNQGDGAVVLENGYRYEGKDPNNYVLFNDELWRVIGVFDSETHGIENTNLVKLIRNESIGNIAWDLKGTYGSNYWETSHIQTVLNDEFFNRKGDFLLLA